jgi:cytochrome c-type biogenesis protein CcmH/NrfG
MNSLQKILFISGVLVSGTGYVQRAVAAQADQPLLSSPATAQDDSPAQQRIAAARQQLKVDPKKVQAYNELAIGFLRRVRETADPNYLNQADDALAQGLKLDSTDFQLQRTQVALMLSRHQFLEARELATALHHRVPDDVMTYGCLAEADMGLGNYSEAETNAQWMMNLRPNNTPALLVGARLRVLFGDNRGAIEFLNRAGAQTSPVEVEEQAWIANQIASILIDSGQIDVAAQALQQAAQVFPNYPYTMENLARVRMAQNRAGDAVQLLTQATALDRDPHALYQLAKAQDAAGQKPDARATLAEFEKLASDSARATDESKRDLILMDAERPDTALDALKLAQAEIQTRQDVWTLDAYAWALYANARFQEADAAAQKAIAVGIQSAQIFDHAGHIAQKLNRGEDAAKYFKLTVQSNAASEFANDAFKSASLAMASDDRAPNKAQSAPALDRAGIAEPHATQAAADDAVRTAVPAHAGIVHGAAAFAPVPAALLTPEPTDTSRLIHRAQVSLVRNPRDAQEYAGLGAAYFQRARETGDVSDYQSAEQAVSKSLDIDSADFSADAALGTMAEVCM